MPVYLVVVLHELDDDADVVGVVFDRDDAHDVGGILCVRVLAVLVGEDEAGIGLVDLRRERREVRVPGAGERAKGGGETSNEKRARSGGMRESGVRTWSRTDSH
jgi:hypothetical protein